MFSRFFIATAFALHMHALRFWRAYVFLLGGLIVVGMLVGTLSLLPPRSFPTGEIIRVESGATLSQISFKLARVQVIRSPLAFRLTIRLLGGTRVIYAGSYRFDTPLSGAGVALRLLRGETGIPPIRVTFPEGITAREMASLLEGALVTNDFGVAFLGEAQPHEGYLFPDTYLFSSQESPQSLVKHLRSTFETRTTSLEPALQASGHSLDEVVTMASIIEREANTATDRRIIAGILWKRLALSMPLQVDAVFAYIKGVNAYAPTFADLKIESPYNTYLHKGLPPTPIGNPGFDALVAALTPTKTNYLYYLTGNEGTMHYATTFAGHQMNRAKYLK